MIQLEHIRFGYGYKKDLFRDLSLSLPAGRIVGLLGENGEGKTTLMNLIAGSLLPRGGKIFVNGESPSSRTARALSEVFLFPEEMPCPALSIKDFYATIAPFYPNYSQARAGEILSQFGLEWKMNLGKLSQGQKKKALLTLALASGCRVLLLDEPSNGLDIPSKSILRQLLKSYISKDQLVLISTHQVRDIDDIIDQVVMLDDNKILCSYSIEQIKERLVFAPVTPEMAHLLIYQEYGPVGPVGVFPRKQWGDGESTFSMELFFNAMIKQPKLIFSIMEEK